MLIVGTGAIATLFAQRLEQAGSSFQMFGPPSQRTGILESRFPGSVVTVAHEVTPHRLWVVCLKSWQNRDKVKALRSAPAPSAVLVVQNGLEPENDWNTLCPGGVERALCSYGVRTISPGVIQGGEEGQLVLPEGSCFSAPLEEAGFECRETGNLTRAVWHKLAVNASLNVAAAVFGLKNGEVLSHPQAALLAQAASQEVRLLAISCGVDWGEADPWSITRKVAYQTRENVCSTLADLRVGRPTEYNSINGRLLDLAERVGLPVPALRELDLRFGVAEVGLEAAC